MKSEGRCNFCKKIISGNMIKKHLLSCAERKKANESEKPAVSIFMVKAGSGPFWIYFEIGSSALLEDIDNFLRDIWLECCGHLSMFAIGNNTYMSNPQKEYGDKNMDIQLKRILHPGIKFNHEYDFGTTTKLLLECISERKGVIPSKINVLARNKLPEFRCKCGKLANKLCVECTNGGGGFLCNECAKKHECGEEMLLSLVNSPRMGMCGYGGSAMEEEWY